MSGRLTFEQCLKIATGRTGMTAEDFGLADPGAPCWRVAINRAFVRGHAERPAGPDEQLVVNLGHVLAELYDLGLSAAEIAEQKALLLSEKIRPRFPDYDVCGCGGGLCSLPTVGAAS